MTDIERLTRERDELRAEVEALRADKQCTCPPWSPSTDGPEEDCPNHGRRYADWIARGDYWQTEAERLRHLLGSHADGHRCTCTETRPGTTNSPPEWEQDPWCPTHPDVDYIAAQHTTVRAALDSITRAAAHPHKGPHDTDASMLREAERRIERGFAPGGSNTTTTVRSVLRAVADGLPCTCNATGGWAKGQGPDPARCPVHGEVATDG